MAKASDVKNGNVLRFNGELVQVEEFLHRTPGNLRAFYQARMRNVKSGKLVEYRFRTDEEVDIARVETNDYQYLYDEGDSLVVMDNTTYDQHNVPKALFGPAVKFLKEGMNVIVAFESDEPKDFLDLVMKLRETQSSKYTQRDTPIFTCVQTPIEQIMDQLF